MNRSVLRLLVLLALLVIGAVPILQADYWHGEVDYYPDASLCTSCGYFIRYCNNTTESWGCSTMYYREYPFDCGLQ